MGRLENKVAGAARGQGRSHCVRMAEEGADIIAVDICEALPGVPYKPATPEDLAETVRQVEALDRRIVAAKVDIRDGAALRATLDDAVGQLGRLDVVSAQAGLSHTPFKLHELPDDLWQVMVDITLTGTWNSVKAAVPHILAGGRGGAIVVTTSVGSVRGFANCGHYIAAKHGLNGLIRTMAIELGPERIRVVNLAPSSVGTDMLLNEESFNLFRPDKAPHATQADFEEAAQTMHVLPVPFIEPRDVSNALVFLASEEGRYITGTTLAVDAGWSQH